MTCSTTKPLNEFMPVAARVPFRCLNGRTRIITRSQLGSPRSREREQASFLPNSIAYFLQCVAREHKRPQSEFLRRYVSFSNAPQPAAFNWARRSYQTVPSETRIRVAHQLGFMEQKNTSISLRSGSHGLAVGSRG